MAFKYQAAAEDQGLTIVSLVLKTFETEWKVHLKKSMNMMRISVEN